MKSLLQVSQGKYMLVLLHSQRINVTEIVTNTFNTHFIKIIYMNYPKFLMGLLFVLLLQAEMMLNKLMPCRFNPKFSEDSVLEGIFPYNDVPLAPVGPQVMTVTMTTQRPS